MYIFNINNNINFCTFIFSETILLEKTPAFAIDYLLTQVSNPHQHNCEEELENYIFVWVIK